MTHILIISSSFVYGWIGLGLRSYLTEAKGYKLWAITSFLTVTGWPVYLLFMIFYGVSLFAYEVLRFIYLSLALFVIVFIGRYIVPLYRWGYRIKHWYNRHLRY